MVKKSRWLAVKRLMCRSSKNPESLARGVGLGLFIGFLPSIGFQVILAFFAAGFFNANRMVTILGTLVTNPITAVPIGAFSIFLGDWIIPGSAQIDLPMKDLDWNTIMGASRHVLLSYLSGCLALSLVTGLAGYAVTRAYFALWKTKPEMINGGFTSS